MEAASASASASASLLSTGSSSSGTSIIGPVLGSSSGTSIIGPVLGSRSSEVVSEAGANSEVGIVGLANLGNTCFMNSMLQCLSNVEALRAYFVQNHYEPELNRDNPLGAEGKLAEAFAALLRLMWGGGASVVSPRSFKAVLGRFAPQFAGYGQQDSQELCNYVLDKLHEDCNRVLKKPYVENFEAKNEPDEEIVAEVRRRHRLRNDSRIADLFEGFFKSTVVCPECGTRSVTFDPYMSVAVPLSAPDSRKMCVVLRRIDGSTLPLHLTLPLEGTFRQLIDAASVQSDVPASSLIAAEVFNAKLHKLFTPDSKLGKVLDSEYIYLFEHAEHDAAAASPDVPMGEYSAGAHTDGAPGASSDEAEPLLVVSIAQRPPPERFGAGSKFTGLPMLLSVPRSISGAQLHDIVTAQLRRLQADPEAPPPPEMLGAAVAVVDAVVAEPDPEALPAAAPAAAVAAVPGVIDATAAALVITREDCWKLHYSSMAVGSFGYEALGEVVGAGAEPCRFVEPLRGGGDAFAGDGRPFEYRSLVLAWQPSAFSPSGPYDKARLGDEDTAGERAGCGRSATGGRGRADGGGIELRGCLDLFSREETLDSDNAWYCPKCKAHRQARKKLQLWCTPSVLVFHLKRFSATGAWRRKNDAHVDFPFEIDLAPYVLEGASERGADIYELQAVSNHYGSTGGGHYTAFAKNSQSKKWYKFDDSHAHAVDCDAVVTAAAYVLIYVRRGTTGVAPSPEPEL